MSNIITEYETRIMLTENEYFEIVSYYLKQYPNKHFLQNTNIYLDREDLFLRHKHITLRIRTINDVNCELTLKIKGLNGDQEINDSLSSKEAYLILNQGIFPSGNVKNYLLSLACPLSEYQVITTLYNRRLEIEFPDHLLVVDKNTYGDITDYNLEIESQKDINATKKYLKFYIDKFNLSLKDQPYFGKAHRAIMAAKKDS